MLIILLKITCISISSVGLDHDVYESQASKMGQSVSLCSMVSGGITKPGLLLQIIMTGPKKELAKSLHHLVQTQLLEREKRAKFTMENQFMSLTQIKFSMSYFMFGFRAILG